AVLPVGYSDGYDRLLSNRGEVLIRGQRAPVLGRICMNLMMVDVTDIEDAILEDEVVLLGRQGEDEITADEMAELCETINYEAVARINPDLARVVVL
ncbi:MAG: alanine racemase, partial [Calditrichaeota bacterium]|nr:alanine racemase [Calditrichota bacterium]